MKRIVSIRRADYWLVEDQRSYQQSHDLPLFQSAGRIIGWLKHHCDFSLCLSLSVSIRRADYWLVEATHIGLRCSRGSVSIRRADYWLVEAPLQARPRTATACFNPPGGLLVG